MEGRRREERLRGGAFKVRQDSSYPECWLARNVRYFLMKNIVLPSKATKKREILFICECHCTEGFRSPR